MTYEYPAIYSKQRVGQGPLLASFVAPAGQISEWASVSRLTHAGTGHQRLRNASRVRAIERFLEQDDRNAIPTSLIVALQLPDFVEPRIGQCSTITIPSSGDKPAGLVIDGQHRMFGVNAFDSDMPLNVVALINPEDEEIAFQFLVINSKASKVPTDHVKFLALQYADHDLDERLRTARMVLGRHALVGVVDSSPDSPFHKSVIWPTESSEADGDRKELVLPASIEQALAAISQKNLPDLSNDDALLEFFFTLWRAVRKAWPDLWVPGSKLLQKVGVVTLTMFIIEDLVPLADRGDLDLSDPSAIHQEIASNLLGYISPEFWQREWSSRSLDTSAGRQLVVEALKVVRRNMRRGANWDSEVRLVGAADDDN